MAGTLGDMKTRILSELARPDLTAQVALAINDAILVYQQERFRFSETKFSAPPTLDTVAGQWVYTATDAPFLASLLKIDFVNINVGSATTFELDRDSPENVALYNQQLNFMNGMPTWFAYQGNEFCIAAVPDQAYELIFGLFLNASAPAADDEAGNPWMLDAERLIRARAKYEIATHVTRNPAMAQAMSPSPPMENGGVVGAAYREWKQLKGTANRVTGRGIIRPMAF